jgi:hypothetical protein
MAKLGIFGGFRVTAARKSKDRFGVPSARLVMATVRKTITLTDQQDDWIKAQVEHGDLNRRSRIPHNKFPWDTALSCVSHNV